MLCWTAGRSCHPDLKVGGAFQINLHCFQVDYYPYHLASGDRLHWAKYKEGSSPHTQWLMQAHSVFRNSLLQLIENQHTHSPLTRDRDTQVLHVDFCMLYLSRGEIIRFAAYP